MKKSDQHRTKIIRFNADFKVDKKLFQWGQEWEYHDKYTGSYTEPGCNGCEKIGIIYRIKIDEIYYLIPEIYVVEGYALNTVNVNQFNTTNTWGKKVTQDMIEVLGENDYVKAAKTYLGKNIAAKKRLDKADYAGTSE